MHDSPRPTFFLRDGDDFAPEPIATGPWGGTMRGRLLGALAAREVDALAQIHPDFRCTRLTMEMFRGPKMAPVRVAPPQVIRDGNRIRVVEVTVLQGDDAVGQAKAVLLRSGEQPEGPFAPPAPWDAPTPLTGLEISESHRHPPTWDAWSVSGTEFMGQGVWVREGHDLLPGEPLSPLVRASLTADLASPISNDVAGRRLPFINADYTLYLGRYPRGDTLGVQPCGQISETGLSVGMCVLHDLDGAVGYIGVTAIANETARRTAQ